jgi:hypothetical protein
VGDTEVASWRTTLPFLRDNKTLKSLVTILIEEEVEPQHVATLCTDTVAMLEDNIALECLDVRAGAISPDNYFNALESLQTNTTLKTLRLNPNLGSISAISLIKKNYGLQNLDEQKKNLFSEIIEEGLEAQDKTGEVGTILRLNQAGRRYLIADAGSIAKGVAVLVAMGDDLGCLFYHLLENPLLCDLEHRYVATGSIVVGPVHSNKRPRTSK